MLKLRNKPNNTNMPIQRLLTVEDVQAIFRIGENKAYELMNSAGFRRRCVIKIGKQIRVNPEALQAWIAEHTGK